MKILIFGDSFSISECLTWANLLNKDHEVVNLSQAGSSEYRIYLNALNYKKFDFDRIIVCHSGPYRIYSEKKLFHYTTGYHDQCDLIYSDVKDKKDTNSQYVSWWFENVFDLPQAELYHQLLIDHIVNILPPNSLHISFFKTNYKKIHNFHDMWIKHPATTVNHLSQVGNEKVFYELQNMLGIKQ